MDITCPDCGETKPDSDYYRDKSRTSGRHLYCKVCARRRSAERYRKRNAGAREYEVRGTHKPTLHTCERCGTEYKPWSPSSKFCSKQCANSQNNERRRSPEAQARRKALQVQLSIAKCIICDAMFAPKHSLTKTCSDKCRRERTRRKNSESKHLRRARMYSAEYQQINNLEVYCRDGWTCGICGDPINPNVEYPDMMSASLDHILPISRGGTHTMDNVQASHLGCNMAKGNRNTAMVVP